MEKSLEAEQENQVAKLSRRISKLERDISAKQDNLEIVGRLKYYDTLIYQRVQDYRSPCLILSKYDNQGDCDNCLVDSLDFGSSIMVYILLKLVTKRKDRFRKRTRARTRIYC